MSLKDRIKTARDRKGEPLEVPEWGETVHVRKLTAAEALDLRAWAKQLEQDEPDALRRNVAVLLRIVTLATVDEQGEQLFNDLDAPWLATKSTDALKRIFDRAGALAGMTAEAREDIRKNSPGAGGSPTASPSPSESGVPTGSFSD